MTSHHNILSSLIVLVALLPKATFAVVTSVCELRAHPERVKGKMITVRGEIHPAQEADSLTAGDCEVYLNIVAPDQKYVRAPFNLDRDENFRKWSSLLTPLPGTTGSPNRVVATYYGRFVYSPNKKFEPGVSIRRLILKRVYDVEVVGK